MARCTIAAFWAHDVHRDGINLFKCFCIYFICTQALRYMGLLMHNISTRWQQYYNTTSMGHTVNQLPQRKGSCNRCYSRGKNRVRIGMKHGKNPYPLERIIGMASYHLKQEMHNNIVPKSYCIAIDSHCSYLIARRRKDLIGDMKP